MLSNGFNSLLAFTKIKYIFIIILLLILNMRHNVNTAVCFFIVCLTLINKQISKYLTSYLNNYNNNNNNHKNNYY